VRHRRGRAEEAAAMPELSRAQVAVYGAVAVAILLIGARSLRADDGADPASVATERFGGQLRVGEGGDDVVVHVAGAVRHPGVYRLPGGTRVTDAVERAGGSTPRAAVDAVNLAARLADGQQVVIPELTGPGGTSVLPAGSGEGPISLGTATVEQLDTIEGIGPVTAGDIIECRDQHGGLASIEQLDQISGIGPATMDSLRDRLQP
jgi:competence protein ComEA